MNLNRLIDSLFKDNPNQLKHFDWSKQINYMPKARAQKDCGSCYIIAAMSMIDFRLRIKQYRQKRMKRMLKNGKKQIEQSNRLDSISIQ